MSYVHDVCRRVSLTSVIRDWGTVGLVLDTGLIDFDGDWALELFMQIGAKCEIVS